MKDKGCLIALIPLTVFIGLPAAFCLFASLYGMFDDWWHQRPNFPLPSLAPAYFVGSLIVLVPLALLWWVYYAITKKDLPDEEP